MLWLFAFRFPLRQRREGKSEAEEVETTVYDYFVRHRNIGLRFSGDFPCINAGKPKRPVYIPLEVCSLLTKRLVCHFYGVNDNDHIFFSFNSCAPWSPYNATRKLCPISKELHLLKNLDKSPRRG